MSENPVIPALTPGHAAPKSMPTWANRTFTDFLNDTQTLGEVLDLCMQGITMVTATPNAVRVLYEVGPTQDAEAKRHIDFAERRARLARREVDSDFNLLHSQAVVSLWSALEDLVKTFVARWLAEIPETRREPPWSDLRVKLGEYEQFDEEEKGFYLVELAEQNTGAALRKGVNRFECLLDKLGLSGPVDDETSRMLFEMQQVRNVIAHRRGIADLKFCQLCPAYGATLGKRLMVSRAKSGAFWTATHRYVCELIFRTGEKFGDYEIRERPKWPKCPVCGSPRRPGEERECSTHGTKSSA